MFARYMLDIRDEPVAPAAVRENYDYYRDRIVCFPGTAKDVVPYPAPSEEDPLSLLFADISGALDLQTADGEEVGVWVTKHDALDWEATAISDITAGDDIKVCGSPMPWPTFSPKDETRLLVVGRIVEHRSQSAQTSRPLTGPK